MQFPSKCKFVQASVSEDVAFPYMMEAGHERDTLFILFEPVDRSRLFKDLSEVL